MSRSLRSIFERRQFSRSKLALFLECPRCFYDDLVLRVPRVGGPAFALNLAVDALLKREFDTYRAQRTPHPLCAASGLEVVPLEDERLARWRDNRNGARYTCPATGWSLRGALDDAWVGRDGAVYVVDYKATATARPAPDAASLHAGYLRQVEIYQWLLEAEAVPISDTAYFVYVNGQRGAEAFGNQLSFASSLIAYRGSRHWVPEQFRAAVALLTGGVRPAAAEGCAWCGYAAAKGALGSVAVDEAAGAVPCAFSRLNFRTWSRTCQQ